MQRRVLRGNRTVGSSSALAGGRAVVSKLVCYRFGVEWGDGLALNGMDDYEYGHYRCTTMSMGYGYGMISLVSID